MWREGYENARSLAFIYHTLFYILREKKRRAMSEINYIETQAAALPRCSEEYGELLRLRQRKHWHEMTEYLLERCVRDREKGANLFGFNAEERQLNLVELYHNFLTKFESRLNQMSLVLLLAEFARQFYAYNSGEQAYKPSEIREAIAFLTPLLDKKDRLGPSAHTVLRLKVAELNLLLGGEDAKAVKDVLEEVTASSLSMVEGSGSEAVVKSHYHRVGCKYYKSFGPAAKFYSEALQFLAYTPHEALPADEQRSLAVDMSLAALLSDGAASYNFGEVLAQPLLGILKGTDVEFLIDLLSAFNEGDIAAYERITAEMGDAMRVHAAALVSGEASSDLHQKVRLMALVRIVFQRPPEDRNISYATIAEACRVEIEQVEWLLMRAMSLGLVKGTIDGVQETVQITWLKPRVLDAQQIRQLGEKLDNWTANVHNTLTFVENETPEMFQ